MKMDISLQIIISLLSVGAAFFAAWYARKGFLVGKGALYEETPVEINFLIPERNKFDLDWTEQNASETYEEEISLPADGGNYVIILRISVKEEDVRASLGAISLGFVGVGSGERPRIVATRGVMREPSAGKVIRNEVIPDWHGNISIRGGKLLGGVQVVGLEVKAPESSSDYKLRVGVPCKEARESKVEKLLLMFE